MKVGKRLVLDFIGGKDLPDEPEGVKAIAVEAITKGITSFIAAGPLATLLRDLGDVTIFSSDEGDNPDFLLADGNRFSEAQMNQLAADKAVKRS